MIRADGGRVADLGMTRNTQLSALLRLRAADPATAGYDVVHAHLYRSQVYGRPAAWLAGTPGGAEHRALDRRDAPGAQADDAGRPGAVPGHRVPLRHHRSRCSGTVRERLLRVGGPANAG